MRIRYSLSALAVLAILSATFVVLSGTARNKTAEAAISNASIDIGAIRTPADLPQYHWDPI